MLLSIAAVPASGGEREAAVRRAIAAAVADRMGAGIELTLEALDVNARVAPGRLLAVPAPGARTDQPAVFSLSAPAGRRGAWRRIGSAVATVHVSAEHTVTTRPLARGDILDVRDLVRATGPVDDVPFAPLETPEALAGGRLLRDVGAGTIVTEALVRPVPLVRSGDLVTVRARIGGVIVEGRAVASENGTRGETIRLVNPESRRALQGRVVGRDEVEVLHES